MPAQAALAIRELQRAARLTTTTTGSTVDLQGYTHSGGRQIKVVQSLGSVAGTTPSIVTKIQEGDQSNGSDAADVTGAAFAARTTNGVDELHFRTTKRYVRMVTTFTANTTQADMAVVMLNEKRLT